MITDQQPTILIVEDSPSLMRTYEAQLVASRFSVLRADTAAAARQAIAEQPDLVLLDLGLPDANGMDLLKEWHRDGIDAVFIVITANGSLNSVVDAMRMGAKDYLVKPFGGDRLVTTVKNALETRTLKHVVQTYREKIDRSSFCEFVGESLPMQALYRSLESAAASKATVFITGESGTGKELGARAIHMSGPRAAGPFIAVNCAAIPKGLLESELFGHVKGAFTGATADRDGAATLADGGTLFLDEIGEMDVALQSKLLRFLQLGTFQKVGGTTTFQSDIRFVAATNRDPLSAVRANQLREDLYYRLNVLPIQMPTLRERGQDVVRLAGYFIEKYADEEQKSFSAISPDAQAKLIRHSWPGNIRELENCVRRAIVLNDGDCLTAEMFDLTVRDAQAAAPAAPNSMPVESGTDPGIMPLWRAELQYIETAIAQCGGNIQKASRLLEISPSTIYRKRARVQNKSAA